MIIHFSPAFAEGVYPLPEETKLALNERFVGETGLLILLERDLGLSGVYPDDEERALLYKKALKEYLDTNSDAFYNKSFAQDEIAVAEKLLSWRDELVMSGFKEIEAKEQVPSRLKTLLGVEKIFENNGFLSFGMADRWQDVMAFLHEAELSIAKIVVHEKRSLLHPFLVRLFELLADKVTVEEALFEVEPEGESNLKLLQKALQKEAAHVTLRPLQEDRSLIFLNVKDNYVAENFKNNESIKLSPRQTVSLLPVRDDGRDGLHETAPVHWHFRNKPGSGGGNNDDWVNYMSGSLINWLKKGHQIVDKNNGQRRAARPGDVAVLCRSNAHVVKVSGELQNLGMEVSAETEGLNETVEFRVMMDVLQLLIDPANPLAVSELMFLFPQGGEQKSVSGMLNERIEFVRNAPEREEGTNGRWEYLEKWGRDYAVFDRIENIRQTGLHLSVKDLVQKIIADMDLYGHLIAFGNEDQRRANLQNIIHYAELYNDHCFRMNKGETISGFVDYLGSSDSFNNQAASNNTDAVNVMTYHKSKGLEWPVVVMFDLTSNYNHNFLSKHLFKTKINSTPNTAVEAPLENRFIRFAFWPFGARQKMGDYDADIREKVPYKETEQEVREEELRLLYVGMTRARDYLITTTFNKKPSHWLKLLVADAPESKCNSLSAGEQTTDLFDRGVKVALTTEDFDFAGPAYEPDEEEKPGVDSWFEKRGGKPQNDPLYRSPSKINQHGNVNVQIIKELGYRIRVKGVIDNSTLGTMVHNALFLMDSSNLSAQLQNLIARSGAELIIFPEDLSAMKTAVKQFIEDFEPVKLHRELFMVKKQDDGHVLRGEADLVLEREADLILIDYKTYQGGKEQFMDPENKYYAGKYAGQLNAYHQMAEATLKKPVARNLIFYVMQGAVVELT